MVDIETIKSAIVDREEELQRKFEQEKIIVREHFPQIQAMLATDAALVITGVRRCGKSMLAVMLGENEKHAYVNFEDERLAMSAEELNRVLEAVYSLKGEVDFLIFDEIQNVPGWERFVSRLISGKKIVLTGSNARLLSKELATLLTGRHIDVTLFPFSFREFLTLNGVRANLYATKDTVRVKKYLGEYLEKGGFPLTYKLGKISLLELYKDILERDIIQRYHIKYGKAFKDIARYLVTHISSELSYTQLKNTFMVKSVHTVKNYLSYLQNAYLVFLLERFSFKLKEQALAPKKAYCIDTGLANAVGFTFAQNRGKLMENAVAIELWRTMSFNRSGELYYWKDHQQREVDFVVKEGKGVKQLVQVCHDLSDLKTKAREVKALLKASEELRCDNLLVITHDLAQEERHGKKVITYVPLWRWLCRIEAMDESKQ